MIHVGDSPADARVNKTKAFSLGLRAEIVQPALKGTKLDMCGIPC